MHRHTHPHPQTSYCRIPLSRVPKFAAKQQASRQAQIWPRSAAQLYRKLSCVRARQQQPLSEAALADTLKRRQRASRALLRC